MTSVLGPECDITLRAGTAAIALGKIATARQGGAIPPARATSGATSGATPTAITTPAPPYRFHAHRGRHVRVPTTTESVIERDVSAHSLADDAEQTRAVEGGGSDEV